MTSLGFLLLVILRHGFPAENGNNNASFILLFASAVCLDVKALEESTAFYDIPLFDLIFETGKNGDFRHQCDEKDHINDGKSSAFE